MRGRARGWALGKGYLCVYVGGGGALLALGDDV